MKRSIFAAAAAVAVLATGAYAYTLNSDGTGFVGKGEVQTVLNWNNKQLQDNAATVQFRVSSTTEQEATWTCDRDAGPQTQERSNTTTTTVKGLVSYIARERNQITGFVLTGFDGSETEEVEMDGPAVGSCPTGWTAIDLVVGDKVPVGDSGLFVNGVLLQN